MQGCSSCSSREHHRHALHYWERQAAERVLFCTVTALGLVRLVCQPKLMGTGVKTSAEASALLEAFCRQPGVTLASPDHDGWVWLAAGELRSGF